MGYQIPVQGFTYQTVSRPGQVHKITLRKTSVHPTLNCPATAHAIAQIPKATAKLQRSKDEAAWKAALEINELEAYEDYLGEGYALHEAEAHQRISELEEADAKRRAAQRATEKRQRAAEEAAA